MNTLPTKIADRIILGTWALGGQGFGRVNSSDGIQLIEHAIKLGITQFDTASIYAKGESRIRLKKALGNKTSQFKIIDKVGLKWHGNKVIHDASQHTIHEQINDSLKALNREYLDCALLHWPDPDIPIEESIKALIRAKKEGKIKEWGVCNATQEDLNTISPLAHNTPLHIPSNPLFPNQELIRNNKSRHKIITHNLFLQGAL